MRIQRDKFDMMQVLIVASTLVTCLLVWNYFNA